MMKRKTFSLIFDLCALAGAIWLVYLIVKKLAT